VVERFGETDEPDLLHQVAHALSYQADLLRELGRDEESLIVSDTLIERFGTSDDEEVRERVVQSAFASSVRRAQLDRAEDWLATARRVSGWHAEPGTELARQLRGARISEGLALVNLQQWEDAHRVLSGVLDEIDPGEELGLDRLLVGMQFDARALVGLRRSSDAADMLHARLAALEEHGAEVPEDAACELLLQLAALEERSARFTAAARTYRVAAVRCSAASSPETRRRALGLGRKASMCLLRALRADEDTDSAEEDMVETARIIAQRPVTGSAVLAWRLRAVAAVASGMFRLGDAVDRLDELAQGVRRTLGRRLG
jgi:hypothetical protein